MEVTNFIGQVFYFGYDEKAYTCQQILHTIAKELLGEADYHAKFIPLSLEAGQQMIAQRLRAERHLLILDNPETSMSTPGQWNIGPACDRPGYNKIQALRDFTIRSKV